MNSTGNDNRNDSIVYLERNIERLKGTIHKLENEKIAALVQEVNILRQVVDFQSTKIEKLASLVSDVLDKNNHDVISSLQAIQDDVDSVHVNEVQNQADQLPHPRDLGGPGGVHLDSNMDPALHQVAVAAVAVQAQSQGSHSQGSLQQQQHPQLQQAQHTQLQQHQQLSQQQQQQQQHQLQNQQQLQSPQPQMQNMLKQRKRSYSKRKIDSKDSNVFDGNSVSGQDDDPNSPGGAGPRVVKRPKITVDFLHNPMSVKEIYDEFTKGFKGQIPLCEMDEKYGKHEWRGDSRSKESKRYQRRKKLCDAIERGMLKYGKTADEIIQFIESFRGDKSLTWVMNGNLPADLES
ncbi:uncharacterized protein J8A68_005017 [[Candida] subhashii]|uniref:Transcription activator GCR1-like domain-containing protein n=1 Tax=[Candida] subhashii TaxID=561895 RepID=A0A8J5Q4B2_9ASCO|nr:uncharacterized protein J8A68_005017 [[Candida] subhashii]KAG7661439.1 hypothetical protein J8A68_005017 [[Candida] subhashii]